MKKAFLITMGIIAIGFLSCSLAPDSSRIIGTWWLKEYYQYLTNDFYTNYSEGNETEQVMDIDETHIYHRFVESGVITGYQTNTYTLYPETRILVFSFDYGAVQSNYYSLRGYDLTITYSNFSSSSTNIVYKVFHKI